MLLTICVPTYNRGTKTKRLLDYIVPFVRTKKDKINLVVSDNRSTDNTTALLSHFSAADLTIITQPEFLDTVERHIFNAVKSCIGQYVWFLGDDDIPIIENIQFLLEKLETGCEDFLYFNSYTVDGNGSALGGWFANIHRDEMTVEFPVGATALGLTSMFPGISNSVYKTHNLLSVDTDKLLRFTPIYTHVLWWFEAFKESRVTVYNRPLVAYNVDPPDTQGRKFIDFCKKHDLPDYFIWSIGLIRLCRYLIANCNVTAEMIRSAWEWRRDGSAFRSLDSIVAQTYHQAKAAYEDQSARNLLSPDEVQHCCDWILEIDPGYASCVECILSIFKLAWQKTSGRGDIKKEYSLLTQEFDRLIHERVGRASSLVGLIGKHGHHYIYRTLDNFVAIPEYFSSEDFNDQRDRYVRSLDPIGNGATVFAAKSIAEIRRSIDMVEATNQNNPLVTSFGRHGDGTNRLALNGTSPAGVSELLRRLTLAQHDFENLRIQSKKELQTISEEAERLRARLGTYILSHSDELKNLNSGERLLWSNEMTAYGAVGPVRLSEGWSDNSTDEIWSSGQSAVIEIDCDAEFQSLTIDFQSFCEPDGARIYCFELDDVELFSVSVPVWGRYSLELPNDRLKVTGASRTLRLKIIHKPVGSPSHLWGGPDERQIGIRLLKITAALIL